MTDTEETVLEGGPGVLGDLRIREVPRVEIHRGTSRDFIRHGWGADLILRVGFPSGNQPGDGKGNGAAMSSVGDFAGFPLGEHNGEKREEAIYVRLKGFAARDFPVRDIHILLDLIHNLIHGATLEDSHVPGEKNISDFHAECSGDVGDNLGDLFSPSQTRVEYNIQTAKTI